MWEKMGECEKKHTLESRLEVSATRVERAAWSCGAKRLHASHHGAWNSSRSQLHQQREGRWVLAAAARAPLWSRWESSALGCRGDGCWRMWRV